MCAFVHERNETIFTENEEYMHTVTKHIKKTQK